MKRIIIVISLILFVAEGFSQKNEKLYKKISDSLITYADNLQTAFLYRKYSFRFYFKDTITIKVDEEGISSFTVTIPRIYSNKKISNKLYNLLDSLAQTDVYTNKLFAYNGYDELLSQMNYSNSWQKELANKIVQSIFDHHLRIIGLDAICELPKELFTQELLHKIANVYTPPTLTNYEARVHAQKNGNKHNLSDTAGYARLKKMPEDELTSKEEDILWNMKVDLYRADKANMSLKAYYDSLNRESFKKRVKYRRNYSFAGGGSLEKCLARKKVYKAARMIDTLRNTKYFKDWDTYNFSLDLARLRYKDYPEKMTEKYAHAIDTTIEYLQTGNFSHKKNTEIEIQILDDYYDNLLYIDTLEAYYETAPLVLLKDTALYRDFDEYKPYRIGTRYIDKLSDEIKNLPTSALDSICCDVWYIDKKLPEGYHEKIYNWLIENKGNYEIERYYE